MKPIYLIALLIFSSPAYSVQEDNEFKLVHKDDKKMNNAFKKAKSTLKSFLNLVDKGRDKNSIYGAYVKIEDKDKTEYLWVTDVQRYNEEYYMGYVISTPRLVHNVKNGATIGFRVEDIYDWQHYDKKKNITYGAYTTCVLMDQADQEDRDFMKETGLQCSQ